MRTAFRALAALGWVLLVAPVAHGEPQSDATLRELAEVMTARHINAPDGSVRLRLLSPEDLRDDLPCNPSPATVIGGMLGRESAKTVVYRVAAPGLEARNVCEAQLLATGWSHAQLGGSGLQDRETEMLLCKNRSLTWLRLLGVNERAYLLLTTQKAEWQCGTELLLQPPEMTPQIEAPMLEPPAGAVTGMKTNQSDERKFKQFYEVRNGGSPSQLVAHFRPQFESQDWKVVEQSLLKNVALIVFAKQDAKGDPWNAHLIAVQVGPIVRVSLEIYAHEQ